MYLREHGATNPGQYAYTKHTPPPCVRSLSVNTEYDKRTSRSSRPPLRAAGWSSAFEGTRPPSPLSLALVSRGVILGSYEIWESEVEMIALILETLTCGAVVNETKIDTSRARSAILLCSVQVY